MQDGRSPTPQAFADLVSARELVRKAFESLDSDGKGLIAQAHLESVMKSLMGPSVGSQKLAILLDTHSQVDYNRFIDTLFPEVALESNLKIWLGFMKLVDKFPAKGALQQLLYGSKAASAEGADVVALFLTDLAITRRTAGDLRHLLRNAMGAERAAHYLFNEDEEGLAVRHIPAQLVKATQDVSRYVYMSVAVHSRNAGKADSGGHLNCFPVPCYVTCKSSRKNELEPSFKSILVQEVVLHRRGKLIDLMLLGANLDTNDEAKLGQLGALERLLRRHRQLARGKFCSLIWGDFNNRLVGFEGLRNFVKPKSSGTYEITDEGARFLADCFGDPERRRELLQKDSLVYTGRDLEGNDFAPAPCSRKLRELFHMTVDLPADVQLPLPTYKHQPLDDILSQSLGCRVRLKDVVCTDHIRSLTSLELLRDPVQDYFNWEDGGKMVQRVIREEDGTEKDGPPRLYLQLGWLDSVGIWRQGTAPARLQQWETERQVRAYDHLPMRAVVSLEPFEGVELKVWLGFLKLDDKFPARDALQQVLFGSEGASAAGADVIALFLTDLLIAENTVEDLRHMLRNALGEESAAEYIFNEDDKALLVRHIPAQLVKATEEAARHVSMSVAVNRRFSHNYGQGMDHFDCFPAPGFLTCKSARKNELEPSFKAILLQEVVLHCAGQRAELVLLGANLDTNDSARLGQLQSLERVLDRYQHGTQGRFSALIWGDFNNRLVAFEELQQHVCRKGSKQRITDSGVRFLVECFSDPAKRRALLQKDSLIYEGKDLAGQQCCPPPVCTKIRELFAMSVEADVPAPWPSYKVQPLESAMSKQLGCRLELQDAVCIQGLRTTHSQNSHLENKNLCDAYFNWKQGKRMPQRILRREAKADDGPQKLYMQTGWPDGVGDCRLGTTEARVLAWETDPSVQAFDHLPLRAVLSVTA